VWQILCGSYFNKLINPESHVLELGAGYGHFINNVHCRQKTAVDLWDGMVDYLHPDVTAHVGSVADLSFVPDNSVDFVLASNLFEHLTQPQFAETLAEVRRVLTPSGTLNILQPNYRLAYKEYFDDYTHCSIYSDVSLCDFLETNGYSISECIPGFLPFSIKQSKGPIRPWLIKLYLASPWKPMAKQMLVRARPAG
jgi:ubiquinone/menaquinone biosynthesis C-methylase UbiE